MFNTVLLGTIHSALLFITFYNSLILTKTLYYRYYYFFTCRKINQLRDRLFVQGHTATNWSKLDSNTDIPTLYHRLSLSWSVISGQWFGILSHQWLFLTLYWQWRQDISRAFSNNSNFGFGKGIYIIILQTISFTLQKH